MRTLDVYFKVIRNGAKVTEIYPVDTPTLMMEAESDIKSSLSGEFRPNDDVNWLSDEIQPIIVIDGTEYTCGIFEPTTVTYNRTEGIPTVSVEAYDRCWLVQSTISETLVHLDEGTNYITAVLSLLSASGINNIVQTPTSFTLTTDREDWEIGENNLTIVNSLLSEINYNPLWFDEDGNAILEPKSPISASNIARTYDYDDISTLMFDESTAQFDIFDAPNVFICICQNPDDTSTSLTATAVNADGNSPLSVLRRGKRIAKLYKVDNIASQSALNDYANFLKMENSMIGETITISTSFKPKCKLNEIVAINHPDMQGVCRETAWTAELKTGGTMTHTLERVVTGT